MDVERTSPVVASSVMVPACAWIVLPISDVRALERQVAAGLGAVGRPISDDRVWRSCRQDDVAERRDGERATARRGRARDKDVLRGHVEIDDVSAGAECQAAGAGDEHAVGRVQIDLAVTQHRLRAAAKNDLGGFEAEGVAGAARGCARSEALAAPVLTSVMELSLPFTDTLALPPLPARTTAAASRVSLVTAPGLKSP